MEKVMCERRVIDCEKCPNRDRCDAGRSLTQEEECPEMSDADIGL